MLRTLIALCILLLSNCCGSYYMTVERICGLNEPFVFNNGEKLISIDTVYDNGVHRILKLKVKRKD